MSSSRSKWETFFKDAGIPSKLAAEYAAAFSDNRMRLDMLDDLNKELLHDLGVKAVGDVIAVLRHAKLKHKEITRDRSQSPKIIEQITGTKKVVKQPTTTTKMSTVTENRPIASKAQSTKSVNTTSLKDTNRSNLTPNLQIKVPQKSSATASKPNGRKKLSDRFDALERETKKKEQEEEKIKQMQQKDITTNKPKPTATIFKIKVPSKPIEMSNSESNIKPKQKITLVPAVGKPLNRNKQPSSIFNRLEKKVSLPTTSPATTNHPPKRKQTVFNRLGGIDDAASTSSSPLQKVQKVSVMLRLDSPSLSLRQSAKNDGTSNVFNRLGDR